MNSLILFFTFYLGNNYYNFVRWSSLNIPSKDDNVFFIGGFLKTFNAIVCCHPKWWLQKHLYFVNVAAKIPLLTTFITLFRQEKLAVAIYCRPTINRYCQVFWSKLCYIIKVVRVEQYKIITELSRYQPLLAGGCVQLHASSLLLTLLVSGMFFAFFMSIAYR